MPWTTVTETPGALQKHLQASLRPPPTMRALPSCALLACGAALVKMVPAVCEQLLGKHKPVYKDKRAPLCSGWVGPDARGLCWGPARALPRQWGRQRHNRGPGPGAGFQTVAPPPHKRSLPTTAHATPPRLQMPRRRRKHVLVRPRALSFSMRSMTPWLRQAESAKMHAAVCSGADEPAQPISTSDHTHKMRQAGDTGGRMRFYAGCWLVLCRLTPLGALSPQTMEFRRPMSAEEARSRRSDTSANTDCHHECSEKEAPSSNDLQAGAPTLVQEPTQCARSKNRTCLTERGHNGSAFTSERLMGRTAHAFKCSKYSPALCKEGRHCWTI